MIGKFKPQTIRKKLMLIILIANVITLLFISATFYMIIEITNQHTTDLVSDIMTVSTDSLNNQLKTLEQFSTIIITDREIQSLLSNAKDSGDYKSIADAYDTLTGYLTIYQDQLKNYSADYIYLMGTNFETSTYIYPEDRPPTEVLSDLILISKEHLGRFQVITKYAESEGIYLVRSIRRIDPKSFDYLGTMIIHIDPNTLITQSFLRSDKNTSRGFAIYDNEGNNIFLTEGYDHLTSVVDEAMPETGYKVVTSNNHKYLMVRHTIFYDWTFSSFISYDEIIESNLVLRNIAIGFVALLTVIAIIITYQILKSKFSGPIQDLVDDMEQFGVSGVHQPTLTTQHKNRKDEIGYLFHNYEAMAFNIKNLIEVNYANELLRKESQLKYLRAQINPHFLYNTLDSISWRAKQSNDPISSRLIESLAALLRGSLSEQKKFTLSEEVKLVKHYLGIQSVRYMEILSYNFEVADETLNYDFPHMVLQPIVENALKYSLEYSGESCHIYILSGLYEATYWVEIKNTGSEFDETIMEALESQSIEGHGFGIGLMNIHQRIQLEYGDDYGLQIYNDDDEAVVRIHLPIKENEDAKNYDC